MSTEPNILMRFLLKSDPDYAVIRQAISRLKARREQVYTTPQNIAEFWNICTRPTTARGGLGLSVEAAERRLRLLERHFIVLPDVSSVYSEWKRLVSAYKVSGVNVYDARIVAAMNIHGISNLITFNIKDFSRYPRINVIDPPNVP